jgi:hypothetical protein
MPFGFLGDVIFGKPSEQSSQQTSESNQQNIGVNGASSFGNTSSDSVSSSVGTSTSSQQIAFEDLFKKLYGGAGAAADSIDTGDISQAGKTLFSGGLQFLNNLQGNAGTDALASRLTDTTARDTQLEALKSNLGDFFNESVLPGITSAGVGTGTLGGGRDDVLKALATKAIAGQYSQGAASIISADQGQRDDAAKALASITGQNATSGLSSLSALYGLNQSGDTAALAPYQILSQIIGGPTVLGSSSSTQLSSSLASSLGAQGSSSFGFDFGTGSSKSTGTSKGVGGTPSLLNTLIGSIGGLAGQAASSI